MLKSFAERHAGIVAPALGAILTAVIQIMQVVHHGICLYLKGIEEVDGVAQAPAIAAGEHAVPEIAQIEEHPRVVGALSLSQMNHLVVFQRVVTGVQVVGIALPAGEDIAENSHGYISLTAPQTAHQCRHVVECGRTGMTDDEQQMVHLSLGGCGLLGRRGSASWLPCAARR